jgi:acetyl esterase/lipase
VCRPVRLEDFTGLPPAWWGVGTLDLFHDEDITYVERLRAADVPCEVEMVKGAFYGFDGIVPKAEVSQLFSTAGPRCCGGCCHGRRPRELWPLTGAPWWCGRD